MDILSLLDFAIILSYVIFSLFIGFWYSNKAGENTESFFLAKRSLPWWLLGISMAATTFAADTPLAITEIIRTKGIWGNWIWWCWGIAWVFSSVYVAPLWRRSAVTTDAGIISLRYDKGADALRVFTAVYFGVILNIIIIAWVIGAMSTILSVVTGWPLVLTAVVLMFLALIYSLMSGLWGVVVTDFFQLFIALLGTLLFALYSYNSLPVSWGEVLHTINTRNTNSLRIIPSGEIFIWGFLFFLFIQWWAFYQSSLNVYFAQRIAACRSPKDSYKASLLFNIINFSLRHWPWVIIAVISLYLWPTKDILRNENLNLVLKHQSEKALKVLQKDYAFTSTESKAILNVPNKEKRISLLYSSLNKKLKNSNKEITTKSAIENIIEKSGGIKSKQYEQSAYPLLMRKLPSGLLGLVLVALLSAFMSTIDTHLNWGASYIINDILIPYRKKKKSSINNTTEQDSVKENKKMVFYSRLSMVFLFVLALLVSLLGESVYSLWNLLFGLTAGMGFVYLLRWFWAGINAFSEIASLTAGGLGTLFLSIYSKQFSNFIQNDLGLSDLSIDPVKIFVVTMFSVLSAVLASIFSPSVSAEKLESFKEKIKPAFWIEKGKISKPGNQSLLPVFLAGLGIVFGLLLTFYHLLFGELIYFYIFSILTVFSSILLYLENKKKPFTEN